MSTARILILAATIGYLVVGCSKDKTEQPTSASSATVTAGNVEVPPDGKKFEPAIKPEQLPVNAWYCDMGTVHYARMTEGDRTCPICMMKLKEKTAE